MNPAKAVSPARSAPPALSPSTTAFSLAASVTVLFNTVLAWAKDAYPPLNNLMKSLTGHHWITHGLADLAVFVVLGLVFQQSRVAEKVSPDRVISILVGSVIVASLGLGLWYVFF